MISLYSLEQYSAAWYGGRTLSSGLATETVLVFDEGNDFRKIRKGSPMVQPTAASCGCRQSRLCGLGPGPARRTVARRWTGPGIVRIVRV
jgi:hypothetical protein